MFIDSDLLMSDAQALSSVGDTTSTNWWVLDTGGQTQDYARGEPIAIVMTVDVAADFTTGDETYRFRLAIDSNTTVSASPRYIADATIAASKLTLGSTHVIPIAPWTPENAAERYARIVYTLGGTTPTITVTSAIQPMNMIATDNITYDAGYTIS